MVFMGRRISRALFAGPASAHMMYLVVLSSEVAPNSLKHCHERLPISDLPPNLSKNVRLLVGGFGCSNEQYASVRRCVGGPGVTPYVVVDTPPGASDRTTPLLRSPTRRHDYTGSSMGSLYSGKLLKTQLWALVSALRCPPVVVRYLAQCVPEPVCNPARPCSQFRQLLFVIAPNLVRNHVYSKCFPQLVVRTER